MQDPLLGRKLANFRVESLLGRGGMARVYYGTDVALQRPVAIKVLTEALRDQEDYNRRFVDEARMVATWRHENIIQVYYAGEEDGLAYFVMEYIDGTSLDSRMVELSTQGSKMPHAEVLEIGWAVASALDYAHGHGVIHRDIKPGNVLIARDGRVVLTDFGLALDTAQGSMGQVFGSPHYISPEQARRSADAVPQSDLYSLGVMLFEMLVGQLPFDDPSSTSIAVMHISEEPPRPTALNPALNVATEQVLLKALRKEAEDRYQVAAELMRNLEAALKGENPDDDMPAPLPRSVQPGTEPPRSVSIAEQVALEFDTGANTVTKPPTLVTTVEDGDTAPVTATSPDEEPMDWRAYLWAGIAAVPLLLTLLGFGLLVVDQQNQSTTEATRTAVGDIAAIVTPSAIPTEAPTGTPQATFTPTMTFTPSPSPLPATATEVAATEGAVVSASEDGELLRLRFNLDSLYVWNATGQRQEVGRLAFLGYDSSGNPVGRRFDGFTWSQVAGYDFVDRDRCVRITLVNPVAPALDPVDCTAATSQLFYNAEETLRRDDPRRFWSADGISEFAVFWDGREVGRCDTRSGLCDVYVQP